MILEENERVEAARTAQPETIGELLSSTNEYVLKALIDNPALDESHVCLLLERKELSTSLLEEIAKRKTWRASYRVRRALATHPHVPRLVAMRLLRELHLMDLVRMSLLPSVIAEIRMLAEERVLTQLPQLPMGQRLTLAKRGSSRIAAGLLAQGPEQVARAALDNPFLTESQLLKTLAKHALPTPSVAAVARHGKWSSVINVRLALVRHPNVPVEFISAFAPDLPRRDVEDLIGLSRLSETVRDELRQELVRREKA